MQDSFLTHVEDFESWKDSGYSNVKLETREFIDNAHLSINDILISQAIDIDDLNNTDPILIFLYINSVQDTNTMRFLSDQILNCAYTADRVNYLIAKGPTNWSNREKHITLVKTTVSQLNYSSKLCFSLMELFRKGLNEFNSMDEILEPLFENIIKVLK